MRVLLLAPPGAGKGTQGARIARRYAIAHIASGELLRHHVDAGTDLGEQVRPFLDSGDLVPDELLLPTVLEAVSTAARNGGYVLDGFPRTVEQARAAQTLAAALGADVQVVLSLDVDEAELIERLRRRARSEGRGDDDLRVVRHRLEVYAEKTEPLVDFYESQGILHHVDAVGSVDDVTERVLGVLARVEPPPSG